MRPKHTFHMRTRARASAPLATQLLACPGVLILPPNEWLVSPCHRSRHQLTITKLQPVWGVAGPQGCILASSLPFKVGKPFGGPSHRTRER